MHNGRSVSYTHLLINSNYTIISSPAYISKNEPAYVGDEAVGLNLSLIHIYLLVALGVFQQVLDNFQQLVGLVRRDTVETEAAPSDPRDAPIFP